jgi:hypothetical protein
MSPDAIATEPPPVLLDCRQHRQRAGLFCVLIALIGAALSYAGAANKSATIDEPLHLGAAVAQTRLHDFRVNPEDPPLWKYWAILPNLTTALKLDTAWPLWNAILKDSNRSSGWGVATLYQTAGNNDHDRLLLRSRAAMTLLGFATILLSAWFAWIICMSAQSLWREATASTAAIATAFLLALDPTLLAHAPLIKNDVAMTLCALGIAVVSWFAGRRLSFARLMLLSFVCGAAMVVKFSGLIFVAAACVLLLTRAVLPVDWPACGRARSTVAQRLIIAVIGCASIALCSYASIWAAYGFRYAPAADGTSTLDSSPLLQSMALAETTLRLGRAPTPTEISAWRPSWALRGIDWLDENKIFPQAWLFGLRFVRAHSIVRPAYLLGKLSGTGTWYYFPLAVLFKEPVAILLAILATMSLILLPGLRRTLSAATGQVDRWTTISLAIPAVIYLTAAIAGQLNLGIRHLLPLYPTAAIAIAIVFSRALARWQGIALITGLALACMLVVEVIGAFPNYIAYFNFASGGSRGGIRLLGDSNLDWGQDLPLLARWEREHRDQTIYLSYFGSVDPAFYGIRAKRMPGGVQSPGVPPALPSGPGRAIVAVSASNLQGMYIPPGLRPIYQTIRGWPVRDVLGGTIYLYDFPPRPQPPQ